jgi:hypothetical protein
LRTDFDTLPSGRGTLSIPADRRAKWAARLGPREGPRVGLVWSGNPKHDNDHNRSMPLRALGPVLDLPGIQFVSLQKEVAVADAPELAQRNNVLNVAAQLADLADTAAIVESLDLVITVDSSVSHLTGTLGKPVWLMLPFAPDWRWLLERSDSPWYPTATLFRQTAIADWDGLTSRVADRLREFCAAPAI